MTMLSTTWEGGSGLLTPEVRQDLSAPFCSWIVRLKQTNKQKKKKKTNKQTNKQTNNMGEWLWIDATGSETRSVKCNLHPAPFCSWIVVKS